VLTDSKKKEVAELFSWLFGDEQNEPALKDTRQLTGLGEVVATPEALKVLRKTRNLDEALLMSSGTKARLLKNLLRATGALEQSLLDINSYRDDPEVPSMLEELAKLVGELRGE
jgi:hypothetical protein